jgi:hypothetical protein
MTKAFKPGDRVVWWKQEGGYVLPVLSTVLAVTAKRVKIEAEDDQGDVIRYVLPRSLAHHVPPPKTEQKPPKKPDAGRSKGSGRKGAAARSKRPGQRLFGMTSPIMPANQFHAPIQDVIDCQNDSWFGIFGSAPATPGEFQENDHVFITCFQDRRAEVVMM